MVLESLAGYFVTTKDETKFVISFTANITSSVNRKEIIKLLLQVSIGLLIVMVFVRLKPLYQMIPIISLLLVALVLAILDRAKKERKAYKKLKK